MRSLICVITILVSLSMVISQPTLEFPHKKFNHENFYKKQSYSTYYYREGQAAPIQKSFYSEQTPTFDVTIENDGNQTSVVYNFPEKNVSSTSVDLRNETIEDFKFDLNLKGGHPLFNNKIGYVLLAIVLIGALCCVINMVKICCCKNKRHCQKQCIEVLQINQQQQKPVQVVQQQVPQPPQQQFIMGQRPQQQQPQMMMIPMQQIQQQPSQLQLQKSCIQVNQQLQMPVYKPPMFVGQQQPVYQQKPQFLVAASPQNYLMAAYQQIPSQQQQHMMMYPVVQQQPKQQQQQQGFVAGKPCEFQNASYNYPSVMEMQQKH